MLELLDEKEEERNMTTAQLYHIAAAWSRARKLEVKREEFHAELYASIRCSAVHYDHDYSGSSGSSAADTQAIRIIEMKERYERLIEKEYESSREWQALLESLEGRDRLLMIRYFQRQKPVGPEAISRLLQGIEEITQAQEQTIERERDAAARDDFRRYQEQTRSFRKSSDTETDTHSQLAYVAYDTEEHVEDYEPSGKELIASWGMGLHS